MKETDKRKRVILITVIMIITAACLTMYIKSMNTLVTNSIEDYLQEAVTQGARIINIKVEEELSSLQIVSEGITAFGDETQWSEDSCMSLLRQEQKRNGCSHIGIIYKDGTAITTDGQNFQASDRIYFQKSIEGNCYIEPVSQSRVQTDEKEVMVTSVPIFADNEVKGVLYALWTEEYQKEWFHVSVYNGSGEFYVFDEEKEIIIDNGISSDDEMRLRTKTIFNKIKGTDASSGMVAAEGIKYYYGYAPISTYGNNWTAVALANFRYAFANSRAIIINAGIISGIIILLIMIGVAVYIRKKISMDKLMYRLAFVDEVTGLGNNNCFLKDGKELLKQKKENCVVVICLNLLRFKIVNDIYGYQYGDEVLKRFSAQLSSIMADKKALCYRMQENYFGILYTTNEEKDELEARIKEEIEELKRKRKKDTLTELLRFSVGIRIVKEEVLEIYSVRDQAILACKYAKEQAETKIAIYNEMLYEKEEKEEKLRLEIEQALIKKEFIPFYQPKVKSSDGSLLGCEALARWNHPTKGILPPGAFIDAMEKDGSIMQLGTQLLEKVLMDMKAWHEMGLPYRKISINMSRNEVYKEGILDKWAELAKQYGVPANQIDIEITETSVMGDVEYISGFIDQIHEKGFLCSMDDFGSGYSSLGALAMMPVDTIKVDRTFIMNIEKSKRANSFLRGILELVHRMKFEIVCEGVESSEQLENIREMKIEVEIQGYYFERPLSAENYKKWLEKTT